MESAFRITETDIQLGMTWLLFPVVCPGDDYADSPQIITKFSQSSFSLIRILCRLIWLLQVFSLPDVLPSASESTSSEVLLSHASGERVPATAVGSARWFPRFHA